MRRLLIRLVLDVAMAGLAGCGKAKDKQTTRTSNEGGAASP